MSLPVCLSNTVCEVVTAAFRLIKETWGGFDAVILVSIGKHTFPVIKFKAIIHNRPYALDQLLCVGVNYRPFCIGEYGQGEDFVVFNGTG